MRRFAPEVIAFTGIGDRLAAESVSKVSGIRIGGSGEPTVRILSSAGLHTFCEGAWDSTFPALEVFCSDFVSRVVYSGDHVSNDHQKGLCSLLIGRTAVAEGQRLEELRQELNAVNARLRDVEAGIKSHIHGATSIADFAGLQRLADVDARLDEARRKLAAAQDMAAIVSKPLPSRVPLLSPDQRSLRDVMARSIDSISTDAIARVVAHRQERMAGAGGPWLREGMQYVDQARCPFCDQTLEGSELYAALRQYFSAAYDDYERSLKADMEALLEKYDPATLQRDAERVLRQRDVARTWEGQAPKIDVAALSTDLTSPIESAVAACAAIRSALEMKKGDPLRVIDFAPLEEHVQSLEETLEVLQRAEAQLGVASNEIALFVAAVQEADMQGLRNQIDQLLNQQQRHGASVSALCDEYSELVTRKAKSTAEGQAARQRMNASIESLLARYRDDMNAYLEHFGSAIRIENPRTNHQTKPPSVDYSISIDGVSVPLGKPAIVKDVPCFGNTLSDGEKNLFALALFMAHLKNRADLADVVVVDDPVNSLDQERRLLIADSLVSMTSSLSQVVVLTHEPRLAHMLYRTAASDVRKMLCIRREGVRAASVSGTR
jgi:wobble nucleotide-excising tRNase